MAPGTPTSSPSEEKPNSRRPKDTKFKQQKLPAWQPILTANTVLPAFFAIGIAFIPLGVALLITSNNITEFELDYTFCDNKANPNETCADFFDNPNNTGLVCQCQYTVDLSKFEGTVYMYYGLNNFYQNHRRYVRSRDDNQLNGQDVTVGSLNEDCVPYRTLEGNSSIGYAPCGAIANSLFNDSFSLTYKGTTDNPINVSVNLLKTGIAWISDKTVKFKNPASFGSNFLKPPNWKVPVWELDNVTANNNGYVNEDLIVWMRTAALPTFRKLYRRIDHSQSEFKDGLKEGKYLISINYAYPVTAFEGSKMFVLTTTSWLGGKNPFLGFSYLVVGSLCIILGIVFLIIQVKWGKKSVEMVEVSSREAY